MHVDPASMQPSLDLDQTDADIPEGAVRFQVEAQDIADCLSAPSPQVWDVQQPIRGCQAVSLQLAQAQESKCLLSVGSQAGRCLSRTHRSGTASEAMVTPHPSALDSLLGAWVSLQIADLTQMMEIICRLFSSKSPSTRAEPFERHTILPSDPTRLETFGAHAKADTLWTLQLDALEDVSVPERLISEARLQSMLAERAPHFVPLARVPAHAPMSASSPHPPADPTNGESPGSGVGRDLDAWLLPVPCPFTCIWNASCPSPPPECSPSAIIAPCQLLSDGLLLAR